MTDKATDVVVIGSGIGGLSCAALLARYGFNVTVCESHSIPGGAAHTFDHRGFTFDSGPSLYSGLSYSPSANPLRQVLDAIGEKLLCVTYDTWGCCLPEGDFNTSVGADQFCEVLSKLRGDQAVAEWRSLQRVMEPLAKAAIAIPPAALRFDWGALMTAGRFAPSLIQQTANMLKLTGPFSRIIEDVIVDPFLRNWLDLLCFLLSGLPANGTSAAEMAFMFADWYRPGVVLDYPVGGSGAIVAALVRGLERYGGKLMLNAHVEEVLVEGNRAVGVRLRGGKEMRARQAVVSNASVWDTLKLLPEGSVPQQFRAKRQATPICDSFMHLHLGIDAQGLPSDLACHSIVVNDWGKGVTAPQNVVLVSIPSLLDPSLAPPGKHSIHVYTPGNEPYELWQGMDRRSEVYAKQKQARAEVMWQALERIIPEMRSRCEVTLVGTPLTHERFLRRHRGSYGPGIRAGEGFFPGANTPLPGLLCCGDSTFPGIGLPAVAASGMIAANTLAPVQKHLEMLKGMYP
ncbi:MULTISPECIES: phytoene desaturase family protein [unclassified Coleofasciculus]|uniref:phytoene desaturase family protein n=1 Tax=unclassified Coleofasciculus TaxID=2692782 RepID=UPI00187F5E0E|nr:MULTISPECIES: NAD(P)/FAD-dependent oxidoreductase [unclassified Coleofasciculus]MBE9128037.1 NAD(P)/FAD-dependent oxidoreductase [Coleofasciculus sp. LEGE 07081]MBE9151134.1 NAD(P)/FAD-dependent oxidoreductase [Coleofasciculus sp. LEGE 07092]